MIEITTPVTRTSSRVEERTQHELLEAHAIFLESRLKRLHQEARAHDYPPALTLAARTAYIEAQEAINASSSYLRDMRCKLQSIPYQELKEYMGINPSKPEDENAYQN